MHRVLEYIDTHISETIDLERLAGVASFSPYHFHRLFAAWTGERIGEYVRRRRLELGASRLACQPALDVLAVALGVGFGSAEAFSRAFKVHFGRTPSDWRRNASLSIRNLDQSKGNLDQLRVGTQVQHDASRQSALEEPMKVRLETLDSAHVAYLRYTGPYGEAADKFWKEAVYPWMVTNGLHESARYGISHDDPSITVPEKCRYDACVSVPKGSVLTGAVLRTTLPGGRYAVLDFRGSSVEIGDAWASLLRDWLPESGMQLDGRPCFEYYPANAKYDAERGIFECQICVPVAPL